MRQMKKLLALLMALCMLFALSACGGGRIIDAFDVFDVFDAGNDEPIFGGEDKQADRKSGGDFFSFGKPAATAAPQGNTRTPDFVVYGLDHFVSLYETAAFPTVCYEDASREITGYFTVTEYETQPYGEGQEQKHIRFELSFYGSDAREWGPSFAWIYDDYYDSKLMNDTVESLGERSYGYQVDWNGERQSVQFSYNISTTGWVEDSLRYLYDLYYIVPAGYDGIVIGAIMPQEDAPSDYIYDYATPDTPFFRAY